MPEYEVKIQFTCTLTIESDEAPDGLKVYLEKTVAWAEVIEDYLECVNDVKVLEMREERG